VSGAVRKAAGLFTVASACAFGAVGCLSGENSLPLIPGFDGGMFDVNSPGFHADGAVDGQVIPPPIDSGVDSSDAGIGGGHDDDAGDASLDSGVDAGTIDSGVDAGPTGKGTVGLASGGTVSSSAHYKLVGTVGQGPGNNAVTSSQHYKIHGGVAGASQKP
jgi:hypothetical protein